MNILNIKQILAVSAFIGAVSCKTLAEYKTEVENYLKNPSMTEDHKHNIIKALKHPKLFVTNGMDFAKMHDLKAEEMDKDLPFKFFRIDEDKVNVEELTKALEKGDRSAIQAKLDEEHKEKVEYLNAIFKELPVIGGIPDEDRADDANDKLPSQIRDFKFEALTFDGERLTYSNLYKLVESLKGAFESNRKAADAAKAVIEAIDKVTKDTANKYVVQNGKYGMDKVVAFHLAPTKEEKKKKAEEDAKKAEEEAKKAEEDAKAGKPVQVKPETINFLKIAQKASDKSTSSPENLFYTLIISLVISAAALVFKGFFAEPAKEDDFEESH